MTIFKGGGSFSFHLAATFVKNRLLALKKHPVYF